MHSPYISALSASSSSVDVSVCDPWSPWITFSSSDVIQYFRDFKRTKSSSTSACLNQYYSDGSSSFASSTIEGFTNFLFVLDSSQTFFCNADSVFSKERLGFTNPKVCLYDHRWYLSFGSSHVWRSSDNGIHWDSLTAPGLVNSLLSYQNRIFVGTSGDSALYQTDRDFATWQNCGLRCGRVSAILPFKNFVIVAADSSLYESDLTLSVERNSDSAPRLLYPQPADDFVVVNSEPGEVVRLFSLQGTELCEIQGTTEGAIFDTHAMPSGIYVVHVLRDNRLVSRTALCITRH